MGINQEDYMTTDQLVHVISAKLDEQDKKLDRIEKKIDATIDAHNRLADYIVNAKNEILEKLDAIGEKQKQISASIFESTEAAKEELDEKLDVIVANTTKKSTARKKKDE